MTDAWHITGMIGGDPVDLIARPITTEPEPQPEPEPEPSPLGIRLAYLSAPEPHECGPIPGMNPASSWASRGRSGVWPPFTGRAGHNVWGQVARGVAGTPTNVALEIAPPEVWHKIAGVWLRQPAARPAIGGTWMDAYDPFKSHTRPKGITLLGNGITRVDLSPLSTDPPAFWHWWHDANISGQYRWPFYDCGPGGSVAVMTWLRLTASHPDHIADAAIVAAFSGDTVESLTGGARGDLGIPRHAWLTDGWQLFGYCTASPDAIRFDPPSTTPPA